MLEWRRLKHVIPITIIYIMIELLYFLLIANIVLNCSLNFRSLLLVETWKIAKVHYNYQKNMVSFN